MIIIKNKGIPYLILLIITSFSFSFGYGIGLIVAMVGLVITPILVWKIEKVIDLKIRGKRIEDIYVISCNPSSGVSPNIPQQVVGLCICVDYKEVMKTVDKEKRLMWLSGNPFFNQNVKDEHRLKVHAIIFQDGIHINETWIEFEERIVIEIFPERSKKHESLKKEKNGWYQTNANHQHKSVTWEIK